MPKHFLILMDSHSKQLVWFLCAVVFACAFFVNIVEAQAPSLPPPAVGTGWLGSPPAAASAQTLPMRIGVAAAVSGTVEATLPGQPARRLKSGESIYQHDKVTTGPESRMQILLLDETTVTVAQNSTIVMDEFVYDPSTDAGKVSTSVAKGVFRFVTGKIAHKTPKNVKVKLPVGTIGIRGTIFSVRTEGMESQVILLGPGTGNLTGDRAGAVVVETDGGDTSLTHVGFGTEVSENPAEAPSAAEAVPESELEALNNELQGAAEEADEEDAEKEEAAESEKPGESHESQHPQESHESSEDTAARDSEAEDQPAHADSEGALEDDHALAEAMASDSAEQTSSDEAAEDYGSLDEATESGAWEEHWMAESISEVVAQDIHEIAQTTQYMQATAELSQELGHTSNETTHEATKQGDGTTSNTDTHY